MESSLSKVAGQGLKVGEIVVFSRLVRGLPERRRRALALSRRRRNHDGWLTFRLDKRRDQ
jgi:hypothetical protein